MTPCIIIDIDGTLSDGKHRLHHLRDRPKNWGAYFDAMGDDKPNKPVVALARILCDNAATHDFPVVVCSGRPDSHREITAAWLARHGIRYHSLRMRKADDRRPDYLVKQEMLGALRADGLNPLFVIDDRKQVVDMWRAHGITCLQCAPGDFDHRPTVEIEGKTLLHVLIGPSGAGKSKWLEDNADPRLVISSDHFRDLLCGDFRDQSANGAVFRAMHADAELRLKHGIPVYFDATNLKRKDRTTVALLAPAESTVRYVVIDRPMEEKLRDAGWRGGVKIGDKPLIEAHAEAFESELKSILAGDGLPNVVVEDLRR